MRFAASLDSTFPEISFRTWCRSRPSSFHLIYRPIYNRGVVNDASSRGIREDTRRKRASCALNFPKKNAFRPRSVASHSGAFDFPKNPFATAIHRVVEFVASRVAFNLPKRGASCPRSRNSCDGRARGLIAAPLWRVTDYITGETFPDQAIVHTPGELSRGGARRAGEMRRTVALGDSCHRLAEGS